VELTLTKDDRPDSPLRLVWLFEQTAGTNDEPQVMDLRSAREMISGQQRMALIYSRASGIQAFNKSAIDNFGYPLGKVFLFKSVSFSHFICLFNS